MIGHPRIAEPAVPVAGSDARARHPRIEALAGSGVGVVLLVAAWAVAAAGQPELLLPSPGETLTALRDLATEATFAAELATTLGRAFTGVIAAFAVGALWGTLNGLSRRALAVSQPALASLMALPPVVLVVVSLTWFGPGATTTRLVIVLVAIPLIVVAVQEAVANVDADLLEMGAAFGLSLRSTLRHIVIPAIASPVLAATLVALGQALRVAVMAELLSAADGVGAEIARSRANLETADVFAWALVLVTIVLVIELAILRPVNRHFLRWRPTTT